MPSNSIANRGYVYLIGSSKFGWYKIGKTRRAEMRLDTIGILLPFTIRLVALWRAENCGLLERLLHERFSERHIHGEWFHFQQEDIVELLKDAILSKQLCHREIGFRTVKTEVFRRKGMPGSEEAKQKRREEFEVHLMGLCEQNGWPQDSEGRKLAIQLVTALRQKRRWQGAAVDSTPHLSMIYSK